MTRYQAPYEDSASCRPNSIWTVADVTSSVQVKTAVARAAETFGRLDVVVSNAGISGVIAPVAAPRGIRVNTIHPGPVDNEFQHRIEIAATGATLTVDGGMSI